MLVCGVYVCMHGYPPFSIQKWRTLLQVIVVQRPEHPSQLQDKDGVVKYDWHRLMSDALPSPCTPLPATHPLYILYTSGTTGRVHMKKQHRFRYFLMRRAAERSGSDDGGLRSSPAMDHA